MTQPTVWLGANDAGPTVNIWPAPGNLDQFYQFDWSAEGFIEQTLFVEFVRHTSKAKVIELAGEDGGP